MVARPPAGTTLEWRDAEGPASGPLTLHDVRFQQLVCPEVDDQPVPYGQCAQPHALRFSARRITIDPALRPLLGRVLRLDAAQVEGAVLALPPADAGDPPLAAWYWVLDDPAVGGRVLIGTGGTATPPTLEETEGQVLIGYAVLGEFQGRGYATEAVRHLIPAIFSLPGIRQIEAATYPDLAASIHVLEKNGFVRAGEGFEEGTIAYVLKNPDAPV